jgi:hypothetical protein
MYAGFSRCLVDKITYLGSKVLSNEEGKVLLNRFVDNFAKISCQTTYENLLRRP